MNLILSHMTAGITELKRNPMGVVNKTQGEPLAILNHNEPVFYCVPIKIYAAMINILGAAQLKEIIEASKGEKEILKDISHAS